MILLARHGETDDNVAPPRVQGWIDTPLNDAGRAQARELAEAIRDRGLAAIHSSHLARARETAEIVAGALGLEPVIDERLAESNRGRWEGRLLEEIERGEPDLWAAWRRGGADFRFPDGESLGEHAKRVKAALADVHGGPLPALCVCHGGTIRCAFALTNPRGLDSFHELDVPNGTLFELPSAA
ncbi:MAG: histidine phosphatase family protein [Thermoleophilaceae bacterium]